MTKPTQALILAAGLGSRLQDVAPCKPLTRIHGITLLEIAVRQLASVGIKQVVVATGYRAQDIEAALPAIAQKAGIDVESRRVCDYNKPNGYSVLDGAREFAGEFVLMMADHVISGALLKALLSDQRPLAGATLAIDRRVESPLVDPEDATWVAIDAEGRIERIGKAITQFDAVDCGVFKAGPGLLEAIRHAIDEGKSGSLSDGMQYLADRQRADTVDVSHSWWIDVDDAHALGQAKALVREHLPEIYSGEPAR